MASSEHFNGNIVVKNTIKTIPDQRAGNGYGVQPSSGKTEREVTDLFNLNVNAQSLDELIEKMCKHLALHHSEPGKLPF